MSWWHGADHAGHRKGPDHPDVVAALAEQDRHLGDLLAGLDARGAWPHATLLLVSDHGMTEVDTTLDAEAPLEEAGIEARVLWSSSYATVFLADPERVDDARRVLGGIEGVRVFRREEIPEAWRVRHPTRIGDLLVVTDPPRTFYQPSTVQSLLLGVTGLVGWRSGMHGYDPAHPDMGAVFLAMGRGVPEGRRTGAVRSLDVAPTVAKLLGIEPPRHAEGSALPALEWSAIAAIGPEPGAGGAAGRSVGAGDE